MTNNPTIDGVCKTCLGSGKEYDGAAHTCTACNGISKPAIEPCKVVAWRGINEYGDIVTEWIDGVPTPSVDLLGRPASYYKVELAYADNLQVEVERLQRAEKNDLIAYKAAIEKQKELREEIKALRDSEDKWYQSSVNLTVERDALQSRIDQLEAEAMYAAATYQAARARIEELESGIVPADLVRLLRADLRKAVSATRADMGLDPLPFLPPAPVAVVLPERMTWSSAITDTSRGTVDGWNACLDATAALNGDKP